MIVAVADTHAIIWYLEGNPRLSETAMNFMNSAAQQGSQIAISSITMVEMVYLVEKKRIAKTYFDMLINELRSQTSTFVESSVDLAVALAMEMIERNQVPDMPDRIIAGTAIKLGVPVISRDHKIRSATVQTIW